MLVDRPAISTFLHRNTCGAVVCQSTGADFQGRKSVLILSNVVRKHLELKVPTSMKLNRIELDTIGLDFTMYSSIQILSVESFQTWH